MNFAPLTAQAKGDCLFSSVSNEQLDRLEQIFAKLTPQGWEIPQWLIQLKKACP